jgi:hypothetical protein
VAIVGMFESRNSCKIMVPVAVLAPYIRTVRVSSRQLSKGTSPLIEHCQLSHNATVAVARPNPSAAAFSSPKPVGTGSTKSAEVRTNCAKAPLEQCMMPQTMSPIQRFVEISEWVWTMVLQSNLPVKISSGQVV